MLCNFRVHSLKFQEVVRLDFKFVPSWLLLLKIRVMSVGGCGHVAAFCQYFFLILLSLVSHVTVSLEKVLNALPAQQ